MVVKIPQRPLRFCCEFFLTPPPTTLVQSAQRPVLLENSTTQLQEKVAELNEQGRSPVYLVHFTQNACADTEFLAKLKTLAAP